MIGMAVSRGRILLAAILIGWAFPLYALLDPHAWWGFQRTLVAAAAMTAAYLVLGIRVETERQRDIRRQITAEQKRRRDFIRQAIADGHTDHEARDLWFRHLIEEDRKRYPR